MGARCPRGHLGLLSAHDQVVASLLRALPLPAAPRFSRGNGLTTSPLAPAPLGRCAPRCRTACTLPDSEDADGAPTSTVAWHFTVPLALMASVRRLAAALAYPLFLSPFFATSPATSPPSPLPPVPHGLPLWGSSPRLPAGCDGGPPAPRWACVIWPGRSRVHHPVAVPNWRLYSAYLGRPCGGSATSWFGAGLFCFNRLGPWD